MAEPDRTLILLVVLGSLLGLGAIVVFWIRTKREQLGAAPPEGSRAAAAQRRKKGIRSLVGGFLLMGLAGIASVTSDAFFSSVDTDVFHRAAILGGLITLYGWLRLRLD